jgi:ATP-dependent DNA ligase
MHIGEDGERLFAAAEKLELEGIVAKPANSLYYRGRESGWLKIKTAAGLATDAQRRRWNER